MHWPIEVAEMVVGPQGVIIDDRVVVPPPLSVSGLASALQKIPANTCRRVNVAVDDAWCRTLLLDVPRGVRSRDELQGLIMHRLRDVFGPELANSPWCLASRSALPWRFSMLAVGDRRLVAICPGAVRQAIVDWAKTTNRHLTGFDSAWGSRLANLPVAPAGALAICTGNRMTVGAWSERAWIGWRSFVATDANQAQRELLRWLRGLSWDADSAVVWYHGWQGDWADDRHFVLRQLPLLRKFGHRSAFDFRPEFGGSPRYPRRQKIIFSAAILTLLAAIWVSMPEEELTDASDIVAAVPRDIADRPIVNQVTEYLPAERDVALDETREVVTWPIILGVFEQRGRRWILYSTAGNSDSVPLGGVIDRRFRIDRALSERVILTDLHSGEQREIQLGESGVKP